MREVRGRESCVIEREEKEQEREVWRGNNSGGEGEKRGEEEGEGGERGKKAREGLKGDGVP